VLPPDEVQASALKTAGCERFPITPFPGTDIISMAKVCRFLSSSTGGCEDENALHPELGQARRDSGSLETSESATIRPIQGVSYAKSCL
jgi:hypothetical protein